MKLNEIPQGEYETGFKAGAMALAESLIQSIDIGESAGHQMTSTDYKKAITHVLNELEEASKPKIILDS